MPTWGQIDDWFQRWKNHVQASLIHTQVGVVLLWGAELLKSQDEISQSLPWEIHYSEAHLTPILLTSKCRARTKSLKLIGHDHCRGWSRASVLVSRGQWRMYQSHRRTPGLLSSDRHMCTVPGLHTRPCFHMNPRHSKWVFKKHDDDSIKMFYSNCHL